MEAILAVARWITTSSSAILPKPGPGSTQMRSRETPARMRVRAWSPRKPITWRMIGADSGRVNLRLPARRTVGATTPRAEERPIVRASASPVAGNSG